MTIEKQGPNVRDFEISEETIQSIRNDIERGVAAGVVDQDFAKASENMPIFIIRPLKLGEDKALIGVQKERCDGNELELRHGEPAEKIVPRSLIGAAVFLGEGSCWVRFVAGDYSKMIYLPNC